MTFDIQLEMGRHRPYDHEGASWCFGDPFIKSTSFKKAYTLYAPDLETFSNLSQYHGDEAGQKFLAGLEHNYLDRIDTNDKPGWYTPSEYSLDYMGSKRSHPEAQASPKDFNGYLLQPGDPPGRRLWGQSVYDPDKYKGGAYDPYWEMYDKYPSILTGMGIGTDEAGVRHLSLPDNPNHPMDRQNAQIAHNEDSDKKMQTMLAKQFMDAYGSSDSDTRRVATMLGQMLGSMGVTDWIPSPTYYNSRSAAYPGSYKLRFRSPAQVMMPSHGMPGSGVWEEIIHLADDHYGAYGDTVSERAEGATPVAQGLKYDFNDTFGGDLGEITGEMERLYDSWGRGGPRYADDHEYIELLNHMYNLGSEGENAPGLLGKYANHPLPSASNSQFANYEFKDGRLGNRTTATEAFNSMLNGRMTGNERGVRTIRNKLPHTEKAVQDAIKVSLEDSD